MTVQVHSIFNLSIGEKKSMHLHFKTIHKLRYARRNKSTLSAEAFTS